MSKFTLDNAGNYGEVRSVNGIKPDEHGNVNVGGFYVRQPEMLNYGNSIIRPDIVDAVLDAMSKNVTMPNVNINYWGRQSAVGVYYNISCTFVDDFDKNNDYVTIGWFGGDGDFSKSNVFATQEAYDTYVASQS